MSGERAGTAAAPRDRCHRTPATSRAEIDGILDISRSNQKLVDLAAGGSISLPVRQVGFYAGDG